MKAIISPSLLSADFTKLGAEAAALAKAGITWLHLDIIDGHFAPNITFGPPVIGALRKSSALFFDCHLMIESPERHIEAIARAGADLIVIHIEAAAHPQRLLCQIRDLGPRAGVALDPDTEIGRLRWLVPYMDMALIMGVNPGFSGQKFIPETMEKVGECRRYLIARGRGDLPIQVDGGVSDANCAALASAGATILVSGSAFFRWPSYEEACSRFNSALAEAAPDEFSLKALAAAKAWQRRSGDHSEMKPQQTKG